MRPTPARLLLALVFALGGAAAPAAQPAPGAPEAAFADALALFDAGLYGEAARAFDALRERHPAHPRFSDALFYGGQAELASGGDARAAALLGEFRRRYPAHPLAPRARLALGEYYYGRGEDDRAIDALRDALDEPQPAEDAARALLIVGQAGLRQGRTDAALLDLQRIPQDYPRTAAAPAALYAIGYAEAERGDWTAAAEAFGRLALRYRRSAEDRAVGLALAEAYLRSGQYDRAADEAERRLADLPEAEVEGGLPLAGSAAADRRDRRDRARFLAAEAYLRTGRADQAEPHFAAIGADGPYGRRAAFGRARIALDRDEHERAAEFFARAARGTAGGPAEPADDLAQEALYYEGLALKRLGRLDDAERRLAAAHERRPEGPFADLALFERGLLLYTTRQWEEAVGVFTRVLEVYPTSTHAGESARMLGETYAALRDFPAAERAMARAERLGTASPELTGEVEFQRGYTAAQTGDYAEAERLLMRVHDRAPGGQRAGEALFWAAEAAFQRGQAGESAAYARALERFDRFLRAHPEHRQRDAARYALAWTHFKRGDYARAAEAFERFLAAYRPDAELIPYTADARLRLADSYFALQRWEPAIASYARVRGDGADYAAFQTGQALANAGRSAEAEAAFSRLLTDFPDSPLRPAARYGLGDLHFQREQYDRAVAVFQEVISQHPASPIAAKAQFAIGDARYNQGRLGEAAAAYRLVIERYPRSPLVADALSALELSLGALGRDDEVARVVETFAAQNPGVEGVDELRFRQAEARYQRGDTRGAISDFRALLDRTADPNLRAPLLLYLGRAHGDLGEAQQAEVFYRRLLDRHPESPLRGEAGRRLGQIALDRRQPGDALPLFRQAAAEADSPADAAEARLGEASALIALRRHAEAEPLLQAVVADAPSAATAARARLRLADLYDATDRRRQAAVLYEEVARAEDDALGAEATARLAAALVASGDAQGALDATDRLRFEQRFAGFPEHVSEVLLARARAFRRLGQTGRAQETFDRVIQAYADTPAAAVARRERGA